MAWHDGVREIWFATVDGAAHASVPPVRLRAVVDEEEGLSAPAVASAGDVFGVAWADTANGRVRFQVVGADGAPRGPSVIVHDGLEDPRDVQLIFNGREFGLAAHLGAGVYFTRLDRQGARVDDGRLFAEGESVDSVDAVRWDGRGYAVAYSVSHGGQHERREERLSVRRSVALRHAAVSVGWM